MPSTTLLEIPPAEQVQMRAILRRTRYGYLLAFHILLLCAAGRTPTEIAAFLFCSRFSVYRIVRAYRAGSLGVCIDQNGQLSIAVQSTILMPWLTRSPSAILKKAPRAYSWCRTRGVVPPLQPRLRLNTASRSQRKPYGAGSRRWAGSGNAPNWWPKMTTHTGSSGWHGFGSITNTCKRMR